VSLLNTQIIQYLLVEIENDEDILNHIFNLSNTNKY